MVSCIRPAVLALAELGVNITQPAISLDGSSNVWISHVTVSNNNHYPKKKKPQ